MERKEILFTDITKFVPKEFVSYENLKGKWRAIDYETAQLKGTLIYADGKIEVPDIVINPGLCGYYDIYIGFYINAMCRFLPLMFGKLDSEENFTTLGATTHQVVEQKIDEFLWRSAEMTGESITLRHLIKEAHIIERPCSAVASVRFVPITEEEYLARKSEFSDRKNKRIFATHDINAFMFEYNPKEKSDWLTMVDEYIDSDVESLSIEYLLQHIDKDFDDDNAVFFSKAHENISRSFKRFFANGDDIYPMLIQRGKEIGLEMYMSFRMGQWGLGFPFDVYKRVMTDEKPQYKCLDRDGTPIDRMSYAYSEVREYALNDFKTMMSYGADGISLIYTRGTPYVLFEKPVLDKFAEKYSGIDCRELPNTDSRLQQVRAEIMNDFMREVRALVDSFGQGKKINVHVHTSLKDDMYYGLDVATWVKEGLVDKIIVNNDYHWENLEADVWKDEEKTLIDIEKYKIWAENAPEIITCRNVYGHDIPKETVDEYSELTKGTDIRVFYDLQKDSVEKAKAAAERLISIGAKDICIWDTYHYKPWTRLWHFKRRLGRLDKVKDFDINKFGKIHKVNVLDGKYVGRYCPWWGG